ncbi:MAG: hypothetical protein IT373_31845 [Polyangiaceae bacterium]|nr:hypothetical protein [Polyangiaceae bacterium]
MRRSLAATTSALALAGCSLDACWFEQQDGATGGAAPTSSWPTSSSTGVTGTLTGGPCPEEPLPLLVPEGWVEYPNWSCACRFYVPGPGVVADPLEWGPCPSSAADAGLACRAMKYPQPVSVATPVPDLLHNADGSHSLVLRRNLKPEHVSVIADIEGPVRNAVLSIWPNQPSPSCFLAWQRAGDDRFVIQVIGSDAAGGSQSSVTEGAIGGFIDAPTPTVLARYQDGLKYDWWASGTWFVREDTLYRVYASAWDTSDEYFVTSQSADPEGLQIGNILVYRDTVFWESSSSLRSGINVWRLDTGAMPFVRYLGDFTRGAQNFGTDGVDMVWSYGEGKAPNDMYYPVRAVMTAPFTTDPSALAPRRLRSHPGANLSTTAWQVGCGYATRVATGPNTVYVVRISDGWAWEIPQLAGLSLFAGVGLTCDEVFAYGSVNNVQNVVRIRLDSLGPGMPPD